MPVGDTATVTIVARATQAAIVQDKNTVVTNTAATAVSPDQDDPVSTNNTDLETTTVMPRADLTLVKTAPANVNDGDDFQITYTVTNNGPSRATTTTLSDTFPFPVGDVDYVSGDPACSGSSGGVSCALGTMDIGATRTVIITVRADSPGESASAARVSSPINDPVSSNNYSTSTTMIGRVADLAVVKTASAIRAVGQELEYTLTASNYGPSSAFAVTLVDTLPAGLTYLSSSGASCTYSSSAHTVTCALGDMLVNENQTPPAPAVITVKINLMPTTAGSVVNTATLSGADHDPDMADNTATLTTEIFWTADLSMDKIAPAHVDEGDQFDYTLTVTNLGPHTGRSVVVVDVLPTQVTFVSASSGCTYNSGTRTVTCAIGSLTAGASVTKTIRVTAASFETQATNTASVTTYDYDPVTTNNSDTVVTIISDD
jgi:uncharacterized repeat protein (TIGR01451 family)